MMPIIGEASDDRGRVFDVSSDKGHDEVPMVWVTCRRCGRVAWSRVTGDVLAWDEAELRRHRCRRRL